MKSYTELSQSRKLAEFLPIESADMVYSLMNGHETPFVRVEDVSELEEQDVPCWSLAALLELIPNYRLARQPRSYLIFAYIEGRLYTFDDVNPIDTCFKAIMKLHKQNLL